MVWMWSCELPQKRTFQVLWSLFPLDNIAFLAYIVLFRFVCFHAIWRELRGSLHCVWGALCPKKISIGAVENSLGPTVPSLMVLCMWSTQLRRCPAWRRLLWQSLKMGFVSLVGNWRLSAWMHPTSIPLSELRWPKEAQFKQSTCTSKSRMTGRPCVPRSRHSRPRARCSQCYGGNNNHPTPVQILNIWNLGRRKTGGFVLNKNILVL